jgi:hypothetical protein
MRAPPAANDRALASRPLAWIGIVLLAVGLAGHLHAAHAIGGSRVAYTHHVLGFLLILAVTGAIVAALGWRFWRSRPDVTMLAVGAVQAILGVLVAVQA